MALFDIPLSRTTREDDIRTAKKAKAKAKVDPTTVRSGRGLLDIITAVRKKVEENLGQYKDKYGLVQDKNELMDYVKACIIDGIVAIDTETTGLNPMQDKIVGLSMKSHSQKAIYVPINHKSNITQERIEGQLTEEEVAECLQLLADSTATNVMFNGPFDIRVIKHNLGVTLSCGWDCYVGARVMNENEGAGMNKLKPLHNKYCLGGKGDAFTFEEFFNGITFDMIPINIAYLYGAHDADITLEYYDFQKKYLFYDPTQTFADRNGMNGVAWAFLNIETPIVDIVAELEDTGVALDVEYAHKLSVEYNALKEEKVQKCYAIIDEYSDKLREYSLKHPTNKLSEPINLDSVPQVAILLYDIFGLKNDENSRGTGEKVLAKMEHPFIDALLEYRGVVKLLNTYIDKLPSCLEKDGRVHGRFNQYGADTGRFSSSEPNLQNIPSHNKDIRKMFVATDGYVLMSSDYSQQEPKCLAALCRQHGDSQMYDTFMAGKDLYSEIASKAFNKPYDECVEFRADGSTNTAGKERRSQAKTILLGVLYGRGVDSIAEQLNTTPKKAGDIKESVFKGFPAIRKFEEDSIRMSKDVGYVTTIGGRKRRLPSMMLPDYEVVWKDGVAPDNDPLAFDAEVETEVPERIQKRWISAVRSVPFSKKREVFEKANKEGLWIVDHTMEKDTTKVVNARIQGSAADLTKLAMIKLHQNDELHELGFRMLIPVHDEIIAECPEENAKRCSELLAKVMSSAAEEILEMPIKCDVEITKAWYGESVAI